MAWIVWGLATLFVFFQFLLQASPSVMYTQLMRELAIDVTQVGILSSIYYYSYVVLQMPAGVLVDRFGARKLLLFGTLGLIVGCLLFATTQSFYVAGASRFLMGIVACPGIVSALYLARVWFPPHCFALVVGLTETLGMFGAAVGEPLLSKAAAEFGRAYAIYGCAVFGLVLMIAIFLLLKEKKSERLEEEKPAAISLVLKHIFGMPVTWLAGIYSGFLFIVVSTFASLWGVPFMESYYQLPTHYAALIISFVFCGAALGAPFMGWCADRFPWQRKLMFLTPFFSAILFVFIIYGPKISIPWMIASLFLLGFLSASYALPFFVMRNIIPKNMHAAAMGFTNMMCLVVGAPVLQPLIGCLLQQQVPLMMRDGIPIYSLADYQHVLWPLPFCLVLAAILNYWIPQTKVRT